MKAASIILAVALAVLGLAACDRVREDDARKGVPKTQATHSVLARASL